MRTDQQKDVNLAQLPKELADWLTAPIAQFIRIHAAAGVVLLLFTIAAIVLSNSPWSHQFLAVWETPVGIQLGSMAFVRSVQEWINDALMTLFFSLLLWNLNAN